MGNSSRAVLGAAVVSSDPLRIRRTFLALGAYFLLHVVFRVLVSNTAELDEAEQLVLTQDWALGYRSDPPLYIWIQKLFFAVFGLHVFSLALMKNALLFATCCFTWRSARELLASETHALLAAISLFLLPQIFWESQRDLTHTVLATTMASATFWAGLRTCRRPGFWSFTVLGICAGLGLLSKYNFALFLFAFFVAALTTRPFRSPFRRPWLVWALVLAAMIAGPHLVWAFRNSDAASARFAQMQVQTAGGMAAAYLHSLTSLAVAVVAFTALLIAVYALVTRKHFRREVSETREISRQLQPPRALLRRLLLVELACVLFMVLGFHTRFKDRWLQPLLFFAPIAVVLWTMPRLGFPQIRIIRNFILALGATVLVVLPAIPVVSAFSNRPTRLNAPFAELASKLKSAAGSPSVILANSRYVGGNLRLWFPEAIVRVPEYPPAVESREGSWLIVWDTEKGDQPPSVLLGLVKHQLGDLSLQPPKYLEAPFTYCPSRLMRIGYMLLPSSSP